MAERQTSLASREERRLARPGALWRESPFRAIQRMADEMERMWEGLGVGRRGSAWPTWRETAEQMWASEVDIFQRQNELVIKVDLPGLKKDELTVDVTDDAVNISGERRREHEEEREGLYRAERSYGSFCRVIPLPEGAITENAKATFRDGVLEITMPAPPAARGRRLEITGEAAKK